MNIFMWCVLLPYMQGFGDRKISLPQMNLIIFSILPALKATDRKDTKWKSTFSSPAFKPSTIMVLTPRKVCEKGFLSTYPLDLLRSPIISKTELRIAYARHLRKHFSGSTKMLLMWSSRTLINNAICHGFAMPCWHGCSANGLHTPWSLQADLTDTEVCWRHLLHYPE